MKSLSFGNKVLQFIAQLEEDVEITATDVYQNNKDEWILEITYMRSNGKMDFYMC